MWVVWVKLENFDMLAPSAWFNLEKNARDYSSYLTSSGVRNEVLFTPGQDLLMDDVWPSS